MRFAGRIIGGLAVSAAISVPAQAQSASVPSLGVCAAAAPGFVVLPDSDTCLRIGGFVGSEFSTPLAPRGTAWALSAPNRVAPSGAPDLSRSRIDAAVSLDIRTQTELGPVRAYVSLRHRPVLDR